MDLLKIAAAAWMSRIGGIRNKGLLPKLEAAQPAITNPGVTGKETTNIVNRLSTRGISADKYKAYIDSKKNKTTFKAKDTSTSPILDHERNINGINRGSEALSKRHDFTINESDTDAYRAYSDTYRRAAHTPPVSAYKTVLPNNLDARYMHATILRHEVDELMANHVRKTKVPYSSHAHPDVVARESAITAKAPEGAFGELMLLRNTNRFGTSEARELMSISRRGGSGDFRYGWSGKYNNNSKSLGKGVGDLEASREAHLEKIRSISNRIGDATETRGFGIADRIGELRDKQVKAHQEALRSIGQKAMERYGDTDRSRAIVSRVDRMADHARYSTHVGRKLNTRKHKIMELTLNMVDKEHKDLRRTIPDSTAQSYNLGF